MGTSIKIAGLTDFTKAMAFKSRAVKQGLPKAVQTAAKKAEEKAKEFAPQRSGELKGSIKSHSAGDLTIIIEADTRYAPFVEFGTAKHGAAQPFMRPAQKIANGVLVEEVLKLAKKK